MNATTIDVINGVAKGGTIDPEVAARCAVDTRLFGLTFTPQIVKTAFTQQRMKLCQILDDERLPRAGVCGYRGLGKTTLYELKGVRSICYRQHRFIVVIGKNEKFATRITENMKAILTTTPAITAKGSFGRFHPQKASEYDFDYQFSKAAWFACDPETGNPICCVVPLGANQPIRGLQVFMNGEIWRPTLILVDDLEDDKALKNDELRAETANWMYGPVLECVDQDYQPNARTGLWSRPKNDYAWNPPWRVIYVDTLKHNDAFMAHILNSTDWFSVRLPQSELRTDSDGKKRYYSLVPELLSDEQVRAQVKKAERTGKIDVYCREKMCLPMSPMHSLWTENMFKYYRDRDTNLSNNSDIIRGIIIDPAKTATKRSAYTAMLGFAVDLKAGKFFLRDLINKRMEDDEIIEKTFQMAIALKTRWIALETAGIEMWGLHRFQNEAQRRGLGVEFIQLEASSVPRASDYSSIKEARAAQMLPYYRMGCVWHEEILKQSALERQMLQFPLCTFWDAIDCAGYIPQFMQKAGFYFEAQDTESKTDYFGDKKEFEALKRKLDSNSWMSVESPFGDYGNEFEFEDFDLEGVSV